MKVSEKLDRHFIDDWRHAWKKLSVAMFAVIVALPDAYEAASALGLFDAGTIPENFKWAVRAGALFGIYTRLVRQKAKEVRLEDPAESP